jgi:hypothetical protein
MKPILTAILCATLSSGAAFASEVPDAPTLWQTDPAMVFDATEIDLADFLWTARPIVVFADMPNDPRFKTQLELLQRRLPELIERDVVLVTDTDPKGASELRTKLRPRGFMVVLIGKDGGVKLRKPFPWDVREFSRSIDKMPMRQQELRDLLRGGPLE